jgi:hypothetical protein
MPPVMIPVNMGSLLFRTDLIGFKQIRAEHNPFCKSKVVGLGKTINPQTVETPPARPHPTAVARETTQSIKMKPRAQKPSRLWAQPQPSMT